MPVIFRVIIRVTNPILLICGVLALHTLARASQTQQPSNTDLHEQRAHEYLTQKNPKLAIPEFRAVLAADPQNLDAQANLGVLLFFQQDYAAALPYLRAAVAQKPELSKIRALLGLTEQALSQQVQARADLEIAVPQLTEAGIRVQAGLALVELQASAQDLDKAAATLALVRAVAPADPRVLYATYRIATDQAGEAILSLSLAAPGSAQMHQAMAHELAKARDMPAAIENLRKAVELDPALPGVHYELAEAMRKADDPKLRAEAESQYKLALAQDPHDAHSAVALGDLAAERGDQSAAGDYYQLALAVDPHLPEALIGMANMKTQKGDVSAAAAMLEQVVAADPTNTLAHYRLSTAYRKLGRADDARRELEAYQRYKELKDKMHGIYIEMREESPEGAEDPSLKGKQGR